MEIVRSLTGMRAWSKRMAARGRSIALVPTMGYFHQGHLRLMRLAAAQADTVVVSLFVNSMQFGPQEDLARYPRDFAHDLEMIKQAAVDVLFAPTESEMYADGFSSRVGVAGLTAGLCGQNRPGHFEGVTTVVAKLFNIVQPHCAVFGEKDYQQLAVIRKMVRDLNWDIEIIGHPTVREADGLAMSSRNVFLSPDERRSALCLYNSLLLARERAGQGLSSSAALKEEIKDFIASHRDVRIEYVSLVDRETLAEKSGLDRDTLLAMAIRVGRTRLIDNGRIFSENREDKKC